MTRTQITAEPGMPLITIEREFDAPRHLVFRAHTEPELLAQWLRPRDFGMTVERYDTRDGGRWRYVHTDSQGNAYGFHGVFHGDPSPEAIVQTFEFEGAPGHVKLDSTTLEQRDGATLVRTVSAFPSVQERDAMIASGMERGVQDSADLLDDLLAGLQSGRAPLASPGDVPAGRPGSLDRLEVLIGEWQMEASFDAGYFGPGSPAVTSGGGRTAFEWLEGRFFLTQHFAVDDPAAPSGIAVIGLGEDPAIFTQHYY